MAREAASASPIRDTSTEAPVKSPAVIPTGNVVVVREDELDTDLGSAIDRIRADASTRGARILIVRADDGANGEADEPTAIAPMPVGVAQLARIREREIIEDIGARYSLLAECLSMFADEAERLAHQLVDESGEAPRARVQSDTRRLCEVLSWSREALEDLQDEVVRSRRGMRALSVEDVVRDAVDQAAAIYHGLHCEVVADAAGSQCRTMGRSGDLHEAFFLAVSLTAHRIGRHGRLRARIERSARTGEVLVEIFGYGEPKELDAPESVQRFRSLIDLHGGAVVPPAELGGDAGTGLVVRLPLAPDRVPRPQI